MTKPEPASYREIQDLLDKFEAALEQLKVAYDKYFMGVDRIAPTRMRDSVQRLLRTCEAARPRQTVLRFRLNSLRARHVSYKHYWTRVLTQIENGTYPRHLQRARRRERELAAAAIAKAKPAASNGAEAAPAASGQRPPPPPPPVPGMEPTRVRALYDELVRAKRAAGEDTRGLTYRGLCKQLARDAPKLRKKHGEITFVVSSDGGPVRLKAKVSRSG